MWSCQSRASAFSPFHRRYIFMPDPWMGCKGKGRESSTKYSYLFSVHNFITLFIHLIVWSILTPQGDSNVQDPFIKILVPFIKSQSNKRAWRQFKYIQILCLSKSSRSVLDFTKTVMDSMSESGSYKKSHTTKSVGI